MAYSVTEFAQKIKTKYPQYQSIDDAELVNKIVSKHPEYQSQVDLSSQQSEQQSVTSTQTPQFDLNKAIQSASTQYNLDPDLVNALVNQESARNPNAVSNKGAVGYGQLMPETARQMGLRVDDQVDERKDPAKNIPASAKYLDSMMRKYNDNVELALAAYNAGPGAVDKHGGIPPYPETQDYVKRITTAFAKKKQQQQPQQLAQQQDPTQPVDAQVQQPQSTVPTQPTQEQSKEIANSTPVEKIKFTASQMANGFLSNFSKLYGAANKVSELMPMLNEAIYTLGSKIPGDIGEWSKGAAERSSQLKQHYEDKAKEFGSKFDATPEEQEALKENGIVGAVSVAGAQMAGFIPTIMATSGASASGTIASLAKSFVEKYGAKTLATMTPVILKTVAKTVGEKAIPIIANALNVAEVATVQNLPTSPIPESVKEGLKTGAFVAGSGLAGKITQPITKSLAPMLQRVANVAVQGTFGGTVSKLSGGDTQQVASDALLNAFFGLVEPTSKRTTKTSKTPDQQSTPEAQPQEVSEPTDYMGTGSPEQFSKQIIQSAKSKGEKITPETVLNNEQFQNLHPDEQAAVTKFVNGEDVAPAQSESQQVAPEQPQVPQKSTIIDQTTQTIPEQSGSIPEAPKPIVDPIKQQQNARVSLDILKPVEKIHKMVKGSADEESLKKMLTEPLLGEYGVTNKESLKRVVKESEAEGKKVTFVVIDIKNMKAVNDRYNDVHALADKDIRTVLGENAAIPIQEEGGVLGRTGGDELAAAFPGYSVDEVNQKMKVINERVNTKARELGYGDTPHARHGLPTGALGMDYAVGEIRGNRFDEDFNALDLQTGINKEHSDKALADKLGYVYDKNIKKYVKGNADVTTGKTSEVGNQSEPISRGNTESTPTESKGTAVEEPIKTEPTKQTEITTNAAQEGPLEAQGSKIIEKGSKDTPQQESLIGEAKKPIPEQTNEIPVKDYAKEAADKLKKAYTNNRGEVNHAGIIDAVDRELAGKSKKPYNINKQLEDSIRSLADNDNMVRVKGKRISVDEAIKQAKENTSKELLRIISEEDKTTKNNSNRKSASEILRQSLPEIRRHLNEDRGLNAGGKKASAKETMYEEQPLDQENTSKIDKGDFEDNGDEGLVPERKGEFKPSDKPIKIDNSEEVFNNILNTFKKLSGNEKTKITLNHFKNEGENKGRVGWIDFSKEGEIEVGAREGMDKSDAIPSLLHELWGHYGAEKVLKTNPELYQQAVDIYRSKSTRNTPIDKWVEKNYGDLDEKGKFKEWLSEVIAQRGKSSFDGKGEYVPTSIMSRIKQILQKTFSFLGRSRGIPIDLVDNFISKVQNVEGLDHPRYEEHIKNLEQNTKPELRDSTKPTKTEVKKENKHTEDRINLLKKHKGIKSLKNAMYSYVNKYLTPAQRDKVIGNIASMQKMNDAHYEKFLDYIDYLHDNRLRKQAVGLNAKATKAIKDIGKISNREGNREQLKQLYNRNKELIHKGFDYHYLDLLSEADKKIPNPSSKTGKIAEPKSITRLVDQGYIAKDNGFYKITKEGKVYKEQLKEDFQIGKSTSTFHGAEIKENAEKMLQIITNDKNYKKQMDKAKKAVTKDAFAQLVTAKAINTKIDKIFTNKVTQTKDKSGLQKAWEFFKGIHNDQFKVEDVTRQLDGYNIENLKNGKNEDGPFTKIFFKPLLEGDRAKAKFKQQITQMFESEVNNSKVNTDGWAKPDFEWKLDNGQTIKISKSQRIWLDRVSKDPDGLRHLLDNEKGGIVLNKDKGQIPIRLTADDLSKIKLSEDEQKVSDIFGKVLDFTGKEANKVSNKINGYDIASRENYFPLLTKSDSVFYDSKEQVKPDEMYVHLKNLTPSNLRARSKASNPLIAEGAFEALGRTSSLMETYIGYAEVGNKLDNILKSGGEWNGENLKLQDIMNRAGLDDQYRLMSSALDRLRGIKINKNNFDKFVASAYGKGARAVLMGRLGASLKQFIGIPAGMTSDLPGSVNEKMSALGYASKQMVKMQEYDTKIDDGSAILWRRFHDTQLDPDLLLNENLKPKSGWSKFVDKRLNWLGNADRMVIRNTWAMCEKLVLTPEELKQYNEYYKNPSKATQEEISNVNILKQKVADAAEQIVRDTQPSGDLLDSAEISKNPSLAAKTIVFLNSQNLKNLQMIRRSFAYIGSGDKKLIQKGVANILNIVVLQSLSLAGIDTGLKALRGYYQDKEDNQWVKDFGLQSMKYALSSYVILGQPIVFALSHINDLISNENQGRFESPMLPKGLLIDSVDAITKLYSQVKGLIEDGYSPGDVGKLSKNIEKILIPTGTVAGIIGLHDLYNIITGLTPLKDQI